LPYCHIGFQNSGEKIRHRFGEADRLEAGGLNPLGEKLTSLHLPLAPLRSSARHDRSSVSDRTPQAGVAHQRRR